MKLLLSPHNDDEALFASLTIQQERPAVIVMYDSYLQVNRGATGCDLYTRRQETCNALAELAGTKATPVPEFFAGFRDDKEYTAEALADRLRKSWLDPERVWAPAFEENSHAQHNLVAQAAELAYPGLVTHYLTYTRGGGKSRSGVEVQPRSGEEIARKLRALACYASQLQMDPRLGCWPHFMRDLTEWVAA